mgnify:CR=1 FL=1
MERSTTANRQRCGEEQEHSSSATGQTPVMTVMTLPSPPSPVSRVTMAISFPAARDQFRKNMGYRPGQGGTRRVLLSTATRGFCVCVCSFTSDSL